MVKKPINQGASRARQKKRLCNPTTPQQALILNHLRDAGPLTTTDARKVLDVLMPATRILELREMGYNIVTHWETVETDLGRHRVAEYVLLAGGVHD